MKRYVIPFFIVLSIMTVVSFIIPLRPTKSYSEKRNLAEFPAFSVETLLSGEYFDDITTWFSDTFPGRQTWIDVNAKITACYGMNEVAISNNSFTADAVPVLNADGTYSTQDSSTEKWRNNASGEEAQSSAAPEEEASETEQSSAASAEESSVNQESSENGESSEIQESSANAESSSANENSSAAEESSEVSIEIVDAPEEDVTVWGGINAEDVENVIYGNVLQIGDSAFSYFGFSQYYTDCFVNKVNGLTEKLQESSPKTRVVCALIPQAVGVMVEGEYQEKLHCSEQNAVIEYMLGTMDEAVYKVNMFPKLVEHNDEYLYFRTDHHWTARGAYYGYESICETLGMDYVPLDEFTEWDQGEFIGTLYWSAPWPSELQTDNLYAYIPPDYEDIEFLVSNDGYSFWEWDMIADMSNSDVYTKYMAFIAGDNALSLAINHANPNGKTAVVIKDSCGNPTIPFLIENYEKVYVLDFRAFGNSNLSSFVTEYDVDDVIFCFMLGMIQDGGAISIFNWLVN